MILTFTRSATAEQVNGYLLSFLGMLSGDESTKSRYQILIFRRFSVTDSIIVSQNHCFFNGISENVRKHFVNEKMECTFLRGKGTQKSMSFV